MFASVPDVLRLLAVPFFGYVAWRDVKTRRVPNRTWYPVALLAVVLLAWEGYRVFLGETFPYQQRLFAIQVGFSLLVVVPLAYLFWRIGGFGGADAKAFFVIAILFPTFPVYDVGELGFPIAEFPITVTALGVFSLTILSNTVLVGLAYPFALAARNALRGHLSPVSFVAKPIRPGDATSEYGSLLHFPDRSILSDRSLSGLRSYFQWRGLDLDALRMYLQWRGATLADLRDDPDHFRDPATLPDEPNLPGDGSIATDGGSPEHPDPVQSDVGGEPESDAGVADPWGAEAFLTDIDHSAYGTDPQSLRDGLDALVEDDVVWISPGIPFLVPLFVGLVVALTYGDLLFAAMGVLGLV